MYNPKCKRSLFKSPTDGSVFAPTMPPTKSSQPTCYSDRFIPLRSNDWALTIPKNKNSLKYNGGLLKAYPYLLENELFRTATERITNAGEKFDADNVRIVNKTYKYSTPPRSPFKCRTSAVGASSSPLGSPSHKFLRQIPKPRKISDVPFKVLDAPDLVDDFYLNLLDWSSKDVLSVGLGYSVYTFQPKTCQVDKLVDFSIDGTPVTSLSWSGCGSLLAIGTHDGTVRLYDPAASKVVNRLGGHAGRVGVIAWTGNSMTTGGQDGQMATWDVRTPTASAVRRTGAHVQEICGLRWSKDGVVLASGGNDNRLNIWDRRSPKPVLKFDDHRAAVKALAWSPHESNLLATGAGTADRCIRFYNTLLGRLSQKHDTGSQVCNIAWSKRSPELVTSHGYADNEVVVWSYPCLARVANLKGHSSRVVYLAMSPDGATVATGAGDETLRFWKVFEAAEAVKQKCSALSLGGHIR